MAGDKIGLAPTGMKYNDSDYAIINSYDSATGEVTLDRSLTAYHYGASTSSASTYSGVIDIRGEVFMLSRNVKIAGEDAEAWGCQIVTSEYTEPSGTIRSGMTYMDSVEVYNCSQYDTEKAALRFEGVTLGHSGISNSAIYQGLGWGIAIQSASNLLFKNNIVFSFVKMGININSATNITISGNLVSNIGQRTIIAYDQSIDTTGGILGCAYVQGDMCTEISITDNIVSGVAQVGYAAYGLNCNS